MAAAPQARGIDRNTMIIAGVVVLGAIMSILDTTIVNVAIATLAREFNVSLTSVQWISTGYLLALAVVIPLSGWAADRFGAKRVWMISIALFLVGSALSGASQSLGQLIFFRVLQGLGGGMIMPVGMTLLVRAAGPTRVGSVMSVAGVPMLLGPVLGPVLGGLLVEQAGWRWIFFVNLPIGALALPLAARLLPRAEPKPCERLDTLGVALISPGLGLLVYGLAETSKPGGGGAGAVAALVTGVVLIAAFVIHALRTPRPLIDVRLFKSRAFSASAATTFFIGMGLFGTMLLLPLYYQAVRGETPLGAGLLMAPQGIGAAIMMPFAGRATDRVGPGRVVLGGLALATLGTIPFTKVGAHTSYALLAGSLVVRGLGLGATMMPAMAGAYQTLDHDSVARATSALNAIMRVGGSIGTAVLAVVLQHRLRGGFAAPPAAARNPAMVANAFGGTFAWGLGLMALGFIPAIFLPRRRPAPESAPEPPVAPDLAEPPSHARREPAHV